MDDLAKPQNQHEDVASKVQKLIDERMELHSLVGRVVEDKLAQREAIHKIMMTKLSEAIKAPAPVIAPISKPLEIKSEDIAKKESAPKKGSPLKDFISRKKKPQEHQIQKCESVDCPDCNQTIFGNGGFSGCICYGENQNSKIFLKKSENGDVSIRFSRNWTVENIEMLLETLRSRK
jgi:hypothetical protein